MFELLPNTPKIDFIGKAKYAYVFSVLLTAAAIWVWISRGPNKYGIDYVGGHEILVDVTAPTDAGKIQDVLTKGGYENAAVQSFEAGSNDYLIRISSHEETKAVREKILSVLQGSYPNQVTVLKTDSVGPTLGDELKRKALIALALGLVGIALYVGFRFEFAFAMGALVSLFHDVVIATGVYLFAGYELNGAALAAALTIVGYSVNDTIVIFDKVREELRKRKNPDLAQILNEANNAMLSRTIITTGLTWLSAVSLYVFGGGAIKDLSLYLVAGIVAGAYSTIFIACPIVLAAERFRASRSAGRKAAAKAA